MIRGFIGGKDFDPRVVADYLSALPAGTLVVTGHGQGLEIFVREQAPELGLTVEIPPLRDIYQKPRDVQVFEICTMVLGETLVLVGNGTRVKAARGWLKRARWPLTVEEL